MFDSNQKYITCGIQEKVSLALQLLMWQLIEEARDEVELDYLQVFELKKSNSGLVEIKHTQEQPPYEKNVSLLCDADFEGTLKVFVIDDGPGGVITMLLAEEY